MKKGRVSCLLHAALFIPQLKTFIFGTEVSMCLLSFEEWRQNHNDLTYLIDFCEAIEKVKPDYYKTEYRNRMQYLERVFAYELYHQFRIKTEGRREYDGLRFDAELEKDNWHGEYITFGIAPIKNKFSPDLVLHQSQNVYENNQKLIVEIKSAMKTSTEKQKDIVKLINYVLKLYFESAVFLLFGEKDNLKSLEIFTRLLPEYPEYVECFNNIFIVNSYFEGENQIIKINSLKNVLGGEAVAGG